MTSQGAEIPPLANAKFSIFYQLNTLIPNLKVQYFFKEQHKLHIRLPIHALQYYLLFGIHVLFSSNIGLKFIFYSVLVWVHDHPKQHFHLLFAIL